jgi:hypothetical protein
LAQHDVNSQDSQIAADDVDSRAARLFLGFGGFDVLLTRGVQAASAPERIRPIADDYGQV